MMNFDVMDRMMGGFGGGTFFFMWLTYLLLITLLILGIVALWKYINKKS